MHYKCQGVTLNRPHDTHDTLSCFRIYKKEISELKEIKVIEIAIEKLYNLIWLSFKAGLDTCFINSFMA